MKRKVPSTWQHQRNGEMKRKKVKMRYLCALAVAVTRVPKPPNAPLVMAVPLSPGLSFVLSFLCAVWSPKSV